MDDTVLNLVTHNVAIHFDMLGPFMEDRVRGYMKSRLAITEDNNRLRMWNLEVMQQVD